VAHPESARVRARLAAASERCLAARAPSSRRETLMDADSLKSRGDLAPQLPTMAPSLRRLPKPQCRLTLLNPLRFKFANESGPFEPYEIRRRPQFRASDKAMCSRRRHRPSLTPNHGEKVAGYGASATSSQAQCGQTMRNSQCRQDSAEVHSSGKNKPKVYRGRRRKQTRPNNLRRSAAEL
jgi:hypothetical protein